MITNVPKFFSKSLLLQSKWAEFKSVLSFTLDLKSLRKRKDFFLYCSSILWHMLDIKGGVKIIFRKSK